MCKKRKTGKNTRYKKRNIDRRKNVNEPEEGYTSVLTYLPQWVSFISMEAALHAENGHSTKQTDHHPASVSHHRRHREVRDRLVGELITLLQLFRQSS